MKNEQIMRIAYIVSKVFSLIFQRADKGGLQVDDVASNVPLELIDKFEIYDVWQGQDPSSCKLNLSIVDFIKNIPKNEFQNKDIYYARVQVQHFHISVIGAG